MQEGIWITEFKQNNYFIYTLSFFYQIIIFHAVVNDGSIVETFICFFLVTQLGFLNTLSTSKLSTSNGDY